MTPGPLTPKMLALKSFIRSYIGAHGCAPTFDEMMTAMGTRARGEIHKRLVALEERGHIERFYGRARGIVVIEADRKDVREAEALFCAGLSLGQVAARLPGITVQSISEAAGQAWRRIHAT